MRDLSFVAGRFPMRGALCRDDQDSSPADSEGQLNRRLQFLRRVARPEHRQGPMAWPVRRRSVSTLGPSVVFEGSISSLEHAIAVTKAMPGIQPKSFERNSRIRAVDSVCCITLLMPVSFATLGVIAPRFNFSPPHE